MPKRRQQTQRSSVRANRTKPYDTRHASCPEDNGASVPATDNTEPGLSTTASTEPGLLTTADTEPGLSTTADNRPGLSTTFDNRSAGTPTKELDNKEIYISPSKILFSQNTINYKFGDGKKLSDTLEALKSGSVNVEDIPRITAVNSSGVYVTHDNRRLCVFQKFEADIGHQFPIPVIIGENLGSRRITTTTSGKSVKIMQNRREIETWKCLKI